MCRTHTAYKELASGDYKELLQIGKKMSNPIDKWANHMKRDCIKNTHILKSGKCKLNVPSQVETLSDFIFLCSEITASGDCSHEIKRCLLRQQRSI